MAGALILGGGIAGSAAACLIARAGTDAHLVEREAGPHHKVCGEFLSIETVKHLRQLGLDPPDLGAVPIERIRLVRGRMEVEAPLPFTALGLSRYALDEALLGHARANGVKVEQGVRVLELNGNTARTSRGEREGRHVLLATGKLPVREQGAAAVGRAANGFIGFKMHYCLAPPAAQRLAGTIVLALFDGGYAGLQMVEAGRANLCLVLRRQAFLDLGGDWQSLRGWLDESPHLRQMLADAEPLFERPATIANLIYGLPSQNSFEGPALRLGDRWAMTASLTGDGMAIALRSAFLAAQCILAGEDMQAYHRRLAAQTHRQIRRAMLLQNALNSPALRLAACSLARLHPPLLTAAASATRLPEWDGGTPLPDQPA
ncbi:NAD(P)/FAD-dependent oxidoreductase [Novosphingobium malaysiense]|uniref:Electron transfer flavoprotein n=1 Tax=Novosphingobium malaysiense TaxID=1348853 RepID=A0A0B1ZLU5_9SPHN|nr:FAD-dependent monooxygenase [Novosphingobium malaysiense]KHK90314.1 electron transfer flavoprotein [Novosphingobium malaysiense]